jgi:beta-xylosidase
MPRRRSVGSVRWLTVVIAAVLLVATACEPAPVVDSSNATSQDPRGWFEAGHEWFGDFGDPQIVREGATYYAYSSPTAGRYLPVLTSTDLRTWRIHPRYSSSPSPAVDSSIPEEIRNWSASTVDRWNNNDGLVRPASWGLTEPQGSWIRKSYWAPGVAKIGTTWFAYSAVRVSYAGDDPNGFGRFCLTVASSTSPWGPFRDVSGGAPILCDSDPSGSIDPEPVFDPTVGRWFLTWKSAGKVGAYPSAIKSKPLLANGLPDPAGPTVTLLQTALPWEGNTIEGPSMVQHNGRYYLFYSGNSSVPGPGNSSSYATGYAICPSGPRARCSRVTDVPLLSNAAEQQGRAGGSAFVDADGGLRYAYSFYWAGEDRVPAPRRLAIVSLAADPQGRLIVK